MTTKPGSLWSATVLFVALVLCAGPLAAWAQAPGAPPPAGRSAAEPARKPDLIPMKMNIGKAVAYAPLMVAAEAGFYRDAGIDRQPASQIMEGTNQIQAMVGGSFAYSGTSTTGWFNAVDKGVPITAVAIYAGGGDRVALVARKGAGIKTAKDLVGKKVGSPNRNVSQEALYMYLDAEGIDPKSIVIAPVADVDLPATLHSGAVVAGVTVEPYVSAMVANGTGDIVTRMARYIGGAYNVIVFPTDYFKQNREAVKRFVVAHARAMQFLRQRAMDSVPMVNKWIPESKPEVLRGTLSFYTWDPRFTREAMEGLQRDLDFQTRLGWVRKKLDLRPLIDLGLLQEVEAEFPQYFDDLKRSPERR